MSLFDTVASWVRPVRSSATAGSAPTAVTLQVSKQDAPILEALREVIDPELDVDIVSLGLIRQIDSVGNLVTVRMVLTTPGCPAAGLLQRAVEDTVRALGKVGVVQIVTEPPWSPDDMSADARDALGR